METVVYEDWVGELNTEDVYSFEFDDCDSSGDQDVALVSSMAPDQLNEDRSRDVCIISKVCNIGEQTARELLVRENWDHQKILGLHFPFQELCSRESSPLNCPVCLESCSIGSSNGTQFFELCDHPMHTECAKDFVRNEINKMAGLSQEQFRGSVTCPWCIALKVVVPGFLSENSVAALTSERDYQTYAKVRNSTLARNERHCPRSGCTNIVRFSSAKLSSSALCPTLECSCGHRFCLLCQRTEHWPASCQRVADWTQMETRIQEDTRDLQRELENTRQRERNLRVDLALPIDVYVQEAMAEEDEEVGHGELVRVHHVEETYPRNDQMIVDQDTPRHKDSSVASLGLLTSQENEISPADGLGELRDAKNQLDRSNPNASDILPESLFMYSGAMIDRKANPHAHRDPVPHLKALNNDGFHGFLSSFLEQASEPNPTLQQTWTIEHLGGFKQEVARDLSSTTRCLGEDPIGGQDRAMPQEPVYPGGYSESCHSSGKEEKAVSHFVNADSKPRDLVAGSNYDENEQLPMYNDSEQWLAASTMLKSDAGRKRRELCDCSQTSFGNKCHRRVELKRNYHSWSTARNRLVQANKNMCPTYFSKFKKASFQPLGCEDPSLYSPQAGMKIFSFPARLYSSENMAESDPLELAFLRKAKTNQESSALTPNVNVVSLDDRCNVDGRTIEKDPSNLEQTFVNLEALDVDFGKLDASIQTVDFNSVRHPLDDSKNGNAKLKLTVQETIGEAKTTDTESNMETRLLKSNSAVSVDEVDLNDSAYCSTYIAKNIKDCPKCFCLCEKLSGCDHVRCPRCNHQFCWRCRTDWALAGSYKHVRNCPGEAHSIPTVAEAEEQYQAFLTQHGHKENDTLANKEEFMDEWLCREKQMRRDFDYGNNRSGHWDVRRRLATNMGLAQMNRVREQANQLLVRLQEQERNIELRKKYLISQSLQREMAVDGDAGVNGISAIELEADYARYASVITQRRNVERSVAQHKILSEHSKELPSECCFHLSKILISCQTTLWAYKLDRFFDSHTPVDALVEYNAMELERVESVYTTLEQIIQQLNEEGNESLRSSQEACGSLAFTRESLANCAEYYKRKRNNFTSAWEDAVFRQEGKPSGSLGVSNPGMNEITCTD